MKELVYPNERTLGAITLFLGTSAWISLVAGTYGAALIALLIGFVLYLFAQSALIAHIKGNGVELSESQFPGLYQQFVSCCERLQIKKQPQAFILNGNGGMNAFATKFLGTQYVILMSDVVDAMDDHKDGVQFYIGHELGHLKMKHLSLHFLRWPVLWFPLLGAAYSRARESTCDRHGLACCETPEGAARALAALAAGTELWKNLDVPVYADQAKHSSGFWMSFHELTAGYPWISKRAARVLDTQKPVPPRNFFAYILALFVPYAGRLGAGFGVLILVYLIGVLAAVAIPAYNDYKVKAEVHSVVINSQTARAALAEFYQTNELIPESLSAAGVENTQLAGGGEMMLDPDNMVLSVKIKQGEVLFVPSVNDEGKISWSCSEGEGLKPRQLPASCINLGE